LLPDKVGKGNLDFHGAEGEFKIALGVDKSAVDAVLVGSGNGYSVRKRLEQ
jgi:hypothetical protein